MVDVRTDLSGAVAAGLAALGAGTVEPVVERSARADFGDWSSPVALRAARELRRPPLEIAEALAEWLRHHGPPLVREWTVSRPGYVNARLDEAVWVPQVVEQATALDQRIPLGRSLLRQGQDTVAKTLVEHTATNPNKAAHVGHLRNACIGDTVVRMLRRTGARVEVNNYIDDTGVQVADVSVGIRELGLAQSAGEPFDHYCSRVYAEVCRRYEEQPELLERRRQTLQEIEAGTEPTASAVKELTGRIVDCHLATMARFSIGYDLLTWESDIIALGFWRQAFQLLMASGAVEHVVEGPQAGCWVMPLEDGGATDADTKILVKSDGIATYTAKDIAYQMWKFGLLGRDFHYRWWHDDPTQPATTSARPAPLDGVVDFGHADRVVNVIDARQAYPQEVVRRALDRLGHHVEAESSVHLGYEVVALSAAAAAELGLAVDDGRAFYALSGRRGIEVRADDLLDRAVQRMMEKAPDLPTAQVVAAGAIRYYLLKFSLPQVIAFDFDEALRTTGDTGVYLQYAHARAAGILRKVVDDGEPLVVPAQLEASERELVHHLEAYPHAVGSAAAELSPVLLAAYTFSLATALSDFYENTSPMVRERDSTVRRFRRRLVAAARTTLADALGTLGMAAPDRV